MFLSVSISMVRLLCTLNALSIQTLGSLSIFFLNVVEYYQLSLGQLALVGVAKIIHFEVTCWALGIEPTLLLFLKFSNSLVMGIDLQLRKHRVKYV